MVLNNNSKTTKMWLQYFVPRKKNVTTLNNTGSCARINISTWPKAIRVSSALNRNVCPAIKMFYSAGERNDSQHRWSGVSRNASTRSGKPQKWPSSQLAERPGSTLVSTARLIYGRLLFTALPIPEIARTLVWVL